MFDQNVTKKTIALKRRCTKKLNFSAGTGVWKISSVACGFRSLKIDYSAYPKSLTSRVNEVYVPFNKIAIAIFY